MSPSLNSTLGAASIGLNVSCIVFGVLTTQAYLYFRRYPEDRPFYKALVGILWFFATIDVALTMHAVYYYTVIHYGEIEVLAEGDIVWSLLSEVGLGAMAGIIVKACYAMRLWRFSNRNLIVTGSVLFLIITQLGFALLYIVKSFKLNKFIYLNKLKNFAAIALAFGVLTDVVTALALSFFLKKLRTGFKTSDNLINKLTIYAINTGALTSAISLCTLFVYTFRPTDFYFMAFYFILAKLYAISFICTLNTRKIVRGRGTDREAASSRPGTQPGNSFYMVNTAKPNSNLQARPMVRHSQIKSIEIGVLQDVSIRSDDPGPIKGDSLLAVDPPLNETNWKD